MSESELKELIILQALKISKLEEEIIKIARSEDFWFKKSQQLEERGDTNDGKR